MHHRTKARTYDQKSRERGEKRRDFLNLKSELTRFWLHCNFIDYSTVYKLKRLKQFAEVVISGSNKKSKRRRLRERFVYSNFRLERVCFACAEPATVRHHIIQLQHGGTNVATNLLPLCEECHADIHPWLKGVVNNSPKNVNNRGKNADILKPSKIGKSYSRLLTIESRKRPASIAFPERDLPSAEAFIGLSL